MTKFNIKENINYIKTVAKLSSKFSFSELNPILIRCVLISSRSNRRPCF